MSADKRICAECRKAASTTKCAEGVSQCGDGYQRETFRRADSVCNLIVGGFEPRTQHQRVDQSAV